MEAPEFPSAALGIIVVCDEEVFFVGADEDAVGAVDGGAVEDPVYRAVSIDAVDPLDGYSRAVFLFDAVAFSVTRVGEINAAFGINREVIGRVEGFAVKRLRDGGEISVGIGSGDDAVTGFGAEDASVVIDEESVRASDGVAEVRGSRGGVVG